MKVPLIGGLVALASGASLLASGLLPSLFSTDYLPHRFCYLAQPGLIWSNVTADTLITVSYIAIFLSLFWLASRFRRVAQVRPYLWICLSFGSFIIACAATHFMEMVTVWQPVYRLAVAVKIVCAIASVVTACLLVSRISALAHRVEGLFELIDSEHLHTEALRKSEALLERTNRVAGIGGWEIDLLTNELTWADETARIHGLSAGYHPTLEEGINHYASELHPTLRAAQETAIAGGGGWDLELPLIRVDGRRIWVRLIGEAEIVNGKPVRLFGSLQDKTKEIEQREALRRSQAFLDRTNQVAGIGGWEFDLVTKDLLWSEQTARIHGMPPGHKPSYEESFTFFPPEYHEPIANAINAAVAAGGSYQLELPLFRPDGRRVWVSLIGDVQVVDGTPTRIFGSLQDKTLEVEQREALRKSQTFLDRTNRIAGVGGWEVDLATSKVTWSTETYRLHALPNTYVPSVAAGLSFYAEQDRPIIAAAVERALQTGEPWDLVLQLVRADAKPIWVRSAGSVEKQDGKPVRLVGAFQDTTDQVNARVALQNANERLNLAMDGGGIGIWDWDIVSHRFICDAWMFRLYGLEYVEGPTEMALWTGRLHPEDRPITVAALLDAIEGKSRYFTEFRVLWDDGSTHTIQASGEVFRDSEGHALRMVGIHRDITEARRLTTQLQQQHELLYSIGDSVISLDAGHNVRWMNGAAERMSGWDAADAIGRPASEILTIVYEESRLTAPVYVDPAIARSRRIRVNERAVLISRNGTERTVESCATPIYDNCAELAGSVIVISDTTEHLRHVRETEQISKLQLDLKLKDEFLSHVSHELRSPLTSVYSFASIIADNLAGDTTPEQQQYLSIVLKNVLQLQSMIEDLLTVTQSKEGKLSIDFQKVLVASAIADAIDTVCPAARSKHISLASADRARLPAAWADPTRLRQILIILLDNAIKFTPELGKIHVRVIENESMLRFEVEDTGCGIPFEKRARIFEKLYQITDSGHADTNQLGRIGLGLGLHIARDLVHRQGGNIWVTGEPGHGSIFNFTLPVASEDSTQRRRRTDWPESVAKQLNPAA